MGGGKISEATFEKQELASSIAEIHTTLSQITALVTEGKELRDLGYMLSDQDRAEVEAKAFDIAQKKFGEKVLIAGTVKDQEIRNRSWYDDRGKPKSGKEVTNTDKPVALERMGLRILSSCVATIISGIVAGAIVNTGKFGIVEGLGAGTATYLAIGESDRKKREQADRIRKQLITEKVIADMAKYQIALGQFGIKDPRTIKLAEKMIGSASELE